MALTKMVNGVRVPLSLQEEADVLAEWASNKAAQQAQQAIDDALNSKKDADITALGTRAEMLAEIDAMTGASPQVIAMMKKVAEIVYTNEKGTID